MTHCPPRRALSALAITGLLATMAVAAPVSAASGSFTNPAPISVADVDREDGDDWQGTDTDIEFGEDAGAGSVYPSEIEFTTAPTNARISEIGVYVELTHERLDDLDLMLVGPNGKSTMLMSDAGGDNPYNGYINFYPDADQPFADDSNSGSPAWWTEGFYYADSIPVDWDTTANDSDTFPTPAPASGPSEFDGFYGTSPNGTWSLYAVDDTTGAVGNISYWEVWFDYSIAASPSPSTQIVSGLPNGITDVNLSLTDIDLGWLDDTEFVLESPDGRRAHVLSDAGGDDHALEDVTLHLDDEAGVRVHRDLAPTTGTYRPVDYDDDDTEVEYVGGSDTANLSSALSTFDGADPNGTWKLYVAQEECFCNSRQAQAAVAAEGDVNAISGGWSLDITTADATSTPVITSPASGSTDTDGAVTVTGTATAGALVKVTTGGKTRNTVAESGTWSVSFTDLANGSHTFTTTATDSSGNVSAPATVTVTVARSAAPVVTEADTTAPKVRTVKPRKDEDRIAVSASAMVRFSEAMDPASVKRAVKLVSVETGKAVEVKLTYQASKNRVLIDPKHDLERNTTYLVVVKRAAEDLAGNALRKARMSRFNTL